MSKATEKRPPMGGGHGPGRGVPVTGAKAKDFKGSMGRLLKYIGKYKIAVIVVFVFAIASAVFSIIGPKLMGNATTVLFNGVMGQISGSGEGFDFAEIARILIMLVILYGLSALFSYVQGFIMTGVSNKVTYRLRQDISRKINTLPLSYFDRNSHGDVPVSYTHLGCAHTKISAYPLRAEVQTPLVLLKKRSSLPYLAALSFRTGYSGSSLKRAARLPSSFSQWLPCIARLIQRRDRAGFSPVFPHPKYNMMW